MELQEKMAYRRLMKSIFEGKKPFVKRGKLHFYGQPERSKREDLPFHPGQVRAMFGNKTYWEDDNGKMRCSEHCGNTVREVQ